MTLRELNRTLLDRQFLLERSRLSPRRVVARLVALQAQYAPSPYVALWSRIEGFRKEQLTGALELGTIVKATSFRTTLHVIDASVFPAAAAAYVESVRGRTKHPLALRPLPAIRTAPVGAWPHSKPPPLTLWREPLPDARESAIRIVRAYLAAYGPATREDVQQFTGLKLGQIDPGLDGARARDGYFDLPGARVLAGDLPAPVRFLPAFDSIILAHRDRSRILPTEYRDTVINKKNATTKNTFTVDGFVAGAWRIEKTRLVLEPFAPLPLKQRREVEAEGERLRAWYIGD